MATNNLFAALLRAAPSTTARKVAADCLKKLEPFMERSGRWPASDLCERLRIVHGPTNAHVYTRMLMCTLATAGARMQQL